MKVTEKQLQALVDRINEMTDSPSTSSTKFDGEYKANIGNYHLSLAYGKASLHRVANVDWGIEDVFKCGHVTKKELKDLLHSFIDSYELVLGRNKE